MRELFKKLYAKFLPAFIIFSITILFLYVSDIGCIVKFITGFPCPGCGLTRAWIFLFKGNVLQAFKWHPLFLLVPPLILVGVTTNGVLFKSKKNNSLFWLSFLILFLVVYVFRMAYLFPNKPPMDYNYNSIFYRIYNIIF